uniref:Endonuclease/exonuclease/phosphatase domain-containing protein n=1 Tax=Caenorhabditis japonica TaxID=281687 RepID=A0A8R1HTM4_CAEJA
MPVVRDIRIGELFSDHKLVTITLAFKTKQRKVVDKIRNYKKGDYTSINYYLSNINWPRLFVNKDVNSMYAVFVEVVNNIVAKYVPLVNFNPLKKHYPVEIRQKHKNKLALWRNEGKSENYRRAAA